MFNFSYLICYRKLTSIHIPIRERKCDNVIPCIGDVELDAIRGNAGISLNITARGSSDLNVHLTEVFGENNGEIVAVDGGLDGVAFRHTLNVCNFYLYGTISIFTLEMIVAALHHTIGNNKPNSKNSFF